MACSRAIVGRTQTFLYHPLRCILAVSTLFTTNSTHTDQIIRLTEIYSVHALRERGIVRFILRKYVVRSLCEEQ